jgi:cell division septum initiation protein DivIVA
MPMGPEELTLAGLPRASFGGVRADAVDDLLRRAAWDYREVLAERQRLAQTVDELGRRIQELEAQIAASAEQTSSAAKEPDELARSLFATARKEIREQRDAARTESELTLRKARRRASEIEGDGYRRAEAVRRELAMLEELRDNLSVQLRQVVESVVDSFDGEPVAASTSNAAAKDELEPEAGDPTVIVGGATNGAAAVGGEPLATPQLTQR